MTDPAAIPEHVPSRLDFEPCQRCAYVSDGMRYFRRGRWLCVPCWKDTTAAQDPAAG